MSDPHDQIAAALRAQARALEALADALAALAVPANSAAADWVTPDNFRTAWPAKSWRAVCQYAERRGVPKHKLGQAAAFRLTDLVASSSVAKTKPVQPTIEADYQAILANVKPRKPRHAA